MKYGGNNLSGITEKPGNIGLYLHNKYSGFKFSSALSIFIYLLLIRKFNNAPMKTIYFIVYNKSDYFFKNLIFIQKVVISGFIPVSHSKLRRSKLS